MRFAVVSALAIVASAAPARAQPTPEGPINPIDEARKLANAGKFLEAAAAFRTAYQLEPRPEYLCNVGVAYHKAKDLPRAQLYLGQCMTQGGTLEAEFLAAVRDVFVAVEDKLKEGRFALVDVRLKPANASFAISTFAADESLLGGRLVWLPFGNHTITVEAEGYTTKTEPVAITEKTQQTVEVTLTKADAGTIREEPPPGVVTMPDRPSRRPAVIATIATGAVGVAALGVYLLARSKAESAGDPGLSDPEYQDRVDAARVRQKISWGLAGLAGAGAIVSGYLWYRATRSPATRIEVAPTGDGAAVWVTGGF